MRPLALLLLALAGSPATAAGIRFEVTLDPKLATDPPASGRLVVAIGNDSRPLSFTRTDPPTGLLLGVDADDWKGGASLAVDNSAMTFPLTKLNDLAAGEYRVAAVFVTNRDEAVVTAAGNLYCEPVKVKLDPAGTVVKLTLDKKRPEAVPADTKGVKYLALPSKLLTAFHGRPMAYRVAVVLPPDFDEKTDKKYALLVNIGGFGSRYTFARGLRPDPRFIQIVLDGCGPYGDPYQVNSANNGPYGDALVTEVLPHIEKTYRCLGTPASRFTTGGSTGGWVSLALQIFHPDVFNGCWSQCPDGVDFRALELIDIYADSNAYVNKFGFERSSKRTLDGDTIFSVRHESRIERVLGRGGKWELGGRDWASWNSVYGPKGEDGFPKPLWDNDTGAIDKSVLKHWEKYDLRKVLEKNWAALGPKLAGGKINIWVGDADDYYLNNAVHRLKASMTQRSDPPFDGRILIEMRKPHTGGGWTRPEMLDAMAKRAGL